MKFLITINTDSELISYEAIALAFTLATFDHAVQLSFGKHSLTVLMDTSTRIYGMVQSLELYDLPLAYHEFDDDLGKLNPAIQAVLTTGAPVLDDYDTVLTF